MNAGCREELIERFNRGDPAAAQELFEAYEPYLRIVVRRQIAAGLRAKFDSVDIVQSIWVDLLHGLRESGWRFEDPAQLRAFLLKMTRNRFIDRWRQHGQNPHRPQSLAGQNLDLFPETREPRPSELAQANDLWDQMLELCPPVHHELLRMKREGLPLDEIAAQTKLHKNSVRRILYELAQRLTAVRNRDELNLQPNT